MKSNLTVFAIKAQISHDTELMGDMKIYVRFVLDQKQEETQVSKGKNPIWVNNLFLER